MESSPCRKEEGTLAKIVRGHEVSSHTCFWTSVEVYPPEEKETWAWSCQNVDVASLLVQIQGFLVNTVALKKSIRA